MPPVPHAPEPLAALRARYARALEHVYDVAAVRDQDGIRPGEVAANVFDHEDGLRLIISRDRLPGGEVVLHISAGFPQQCRLADEVRLLAVATPGREVLRVWLQSVPKRFAELSGDSRPAMFIGIVQGAVPHWIIPEGPEEPEHA